MEGNLTDTLLNRLPFWILILPLSGFVVLALFGDWIQREEKAAREKGKTDFMGRLEASGSHLAGILACATVGGSFLLSVWSVMRLLALAPGGLAGLRFAQPYLGLEWIEVAGFRVPFSLLLVR